MSSIAPIFWPTGGMWPFLPSGGRRRRDLTPDPLGVNWPVEDDELDVWLTGYDSATGLYAWNQRYVDADGNFSYWPGSLAELGGTETGNRYGTVAGINGAAQTYNPAKTYNGEIIPLPSSLTDPNKKYVRIRKRSLHSTYGFIYEIINPPITPPHHLGTSPDYWATSLGSGIAFGSLSGIDVEWPNTTFQFPSTGLYHVYGTLPFDISGGTLAVSPAAIKIDCYFVPQSTDLRAYPYFSYPGQGYYTLVSMVLPVSGFLINPARTYCRLQTFVEVFSLPASGHADMKLHLVFYGPSGSSFTVSNEFPDIRMSHTIRLRTGLYP